MRDIVPQCQRPPRRRRPTPVDDREVARLATESPAPARGRSAPPGHQVLASPQPEFLDFWRYAGGRRGDPSAPPSNWNAFRAARSLLSPTPINSRRSESTRGPEMAPRCCTAWSDASARRLHGSPNATRRTRPAQRRQRRPGLRDGRRIARRRGLGLPDTRSVDGPGRGGGRRLQHRGCEAVWPAEWVEWSSGIPSTPWMPLELALRSACRPGDAA